MDLLNEVWDVRQVPGEARRRWFAAPQVELIVWCGDDGTPVAFQLCYDKGYAERAITWEPETGFVHSLVDDGEGGVLRHKATPILLPDGAFDVNRVRELFVAASARVPAEIVAFVDATLVRHPEYRRRSPIE